MMRTSKFPHRRIATLSLGLLAAMLVGCASKTPLNAAGPAAAAAPAPVAQAPAAAPTPAQTAAQTDIAAVDLTRGQAAATADGRFVYFDFDSFDVRTDFMPVIETQAKRMAADGSKRLVIAGHADERGSREYNLALGQRRADAVARSIVMLGGDARRLETVSYGAERPKAEGSNEAAWALNRRAELSPR
jgi:peptidoglycan-associated lipoprotein